MAFKSHGDYLSTKRLKIQLQNRIPHISDLFSNHCFYINGYIPIPEFKDLILAHGATCKDYLASDTTHIIASQMTDSKIMNLRKPVVKPEWILSCISQNYILPWEDFRLYTLDPNQKILLNHFKPFAGAFKPNEIKELDFNDNWIKANISSAPGFLEKFLASSRLHHLSTWKSDLKDFISINFKKKIERPNLKRYILHIDMDCFFASVAIRENQNLINKPVAVAHSINGNLSSTSEIASCNYIAREFGISNGMILGTARSKCSNLVIMPYEYEKYNECSKQLYIILMKYAHDLQPVSCDEAFLLAFNNEPEDLANIIRKEIKFATGCNASVGIGPNILLSRLATKKAKPDGVYIVHDDIDEIDDFISSHSVKSLPGVGDSLSEKLYTKNITTCDQLKSFSINYLRKEFGIKTGEMLYNFSRGIDDRLFESKERQNISVEVNWGVRFQTQLEVELFFKDLCGYISSKMRELHYKGLQITVKLKKRLYLGEPGKFLGCGHCENLSKSQTFSKHIDDFETLFNHGYPMITAFSLSPIDIRGIGLSVTKLKSCIVNKFILSPSKKPKLFDEALRSPPKQTNLKSFLSPKKPTNNSVYEHDFQPISNSTTNLPEKIQKSKDFFAFTTPKPKRSKTSKTIDLQVFEALPSSIQRELQQSKEYTIPFEKEVIVIQSTPDTALPEPTYIDDTQTSPILQKKELNMEMLMPSMSQMDPNVMNELPSSIKKEITRNFKIKRLQQSIFTNKIRGHCKPEIKIINEPPVLGGETEISNILNLVKKWILHDGIYPSDDGFIELFNYLCSLIENNEMEKSWKILIFFGTKLNAFQGHETLWTSKFWTLFNQIDELVLAKYGSRFKRAFI